VSKQGKIQISLDFPERRALSNAGMVRKDFSLYFPTFHDLYWWFVVLRKQWCTQ